MVVDDVTRRPLLSGRWISPSSAERNLGLLQRDELDDLRQLGSTQYVEAGTVVASSGSEITHVHVVYDGELDLMIRLPSGRATMAVVRGGGVIADIPMLLQAPMPFDAVASRETELISLTHEQWMALLSSSPAICKRWLTSIARRLDDDRRRLVVVTTRPLVAQVAFVLLELAEPDPDGGSVVRVSQTTVAHLIGARRQSVTRVLGELRERGLVETRYGTTAIVDEPGLRAVLGDQPLP